MMLVELNSCSGLANNPSCLEQAAVLALASRMLGT